MSESIMDLDKKKTAERDRRRQYASRYYKKNKELLKLKRDIKRSEKRQHQIEELSKEEQYVDGVGGSLIYRTGEFVISFK
jgi:hypothetical protein